MDYNKLRTFIEVAEHGSMTAAAHRLQRTQSAISQQILLLEEELQIRLLERKGGKVLLSTDGERLYRLAKEKLEGIDEEVLRLRNETERAEGRLRIGVLNDYVNSFDVGRHIGEFCTKYPKVTFSVDYGSSNEIEAKLCRNEIDLGFLVYFRQSELFVRRPLNAAVHRVYGSKAYLNRKGPFRSYKDILRADLIDLNDTFACFGTWFRKNAPESVGNLMRLRPAIVAPNHKTAMEIVCADYGLALLPDHLVEGSSVKQKCVEIMKTAKPVQTGLESAYRTNKTLRLAERFFLDTVHEKQPG